jgi:capsular polysaccharide biosynthesis protein
MNDSSTPMGGGQVLDIGRYARAARRQWLVVLAFAIMGGALGWWQFGSSEQRYEATAVVEVGPGLVDLTSSATDSTVDTVNVETEEQVAMSVRVAADAVARMPGALTVGQFQQRSEVAAPQDSSAMLMTFEGETPIQARDGAQAWADAYLDDRRSQLTGSLATSRENLLEREASLQRELSDAQDAVEAAVPGTTEAQSASTQVRTISRRIERMRGQLDGLDSMLVAPGSVLGQPQLPTVAAGLPRTAFVGAGFFVGLLLGLAIALLIERLTDRIRDGRDLQRVTNAPVWAVTPTASEDGDALDLAYDAVATRLLLAIRSSSLRSVVVTAAEVEATATAERVAARLRRLGQTVRVSTDVEDLLKPSDDERILVVGAPPVLADPRTAVLSAEADATLMVVRVKRTRARWLSSAISMLHSCDGSVSGIVMDRRPDRDSAVRSRSMSAVPATGRGPDVAATDDGVDSVAEGQSHVTSGSGKTKK